MKEAWEKKRKLVSPFHNSMPLDEFERRFYNERMGEDPNESLDLYWMDIIKNINQTKNKSDEDILKMFKIMYENGIKINLLQLKRISDNKENFIFVMKNDKIVVAYK